MNQFWTVTAEKILHWLKVNGEAVREKVVSYAIRKQVERVNEAITKLNQCKDLPAAIKAAQKLSDLKFKHIQLESQVEESLVKSCHRLGDEFILHLAQIIDNKASEIYSMFNKLLKIVYQANTEKVFRLIDRSIEYLESSPSSSPSIFYSFKIIIYHMLNSNLEENAKAVLLRIYRKNLLLMATAECSKSVGSLLELFLKHCVTSSHQAKDNSSVTLVDILQVIKCMSCKPPEIFFNKLLDMIAKGSHNMKNSETILEVMIHSKVKASLVTFNTLLDIYISQKNMKMAWYLFDSLIKNQDPKPDAYTYCTMIGGLRRVQPIDITTIESIFEMYCRQNKPDMIVANCMLDVYVIYGDDSKIHLLIESLNTQYGLMPDHATFNTLIKGCSSTRNLGKAEYYFNELRKAGLKPTKVTFNSLMDICVKSKQLPKAMGYLKEMSQEGLEPDHFSYSILLTGVKSSSSEHIYRQCLTNLMSLLTNVSFSVDEVFFNSVMDVACRFGDTAKVEEVYQIMKQRKVNPSSITFGILIKTYGRAKLGYRVKEVFHDMSSVHNMQPNEVTYGSLLEALIQSDCMHEAEVIFHQLPSKKIKVNPVILATMMKGYSKMGYFQQALDLFETYRSDPTIELNQVCFNTVIDVAVNKRNIRLAEDYFDYMCHNQIRPDLITYSILIKGYSFDKNSRQGVALLKQMMAEGIRPDLRIFNTLLELCSNFKDCGKGLHVFSLMKQSGCQPNLITFGTLVKIYGFCREVEKAFTLLDHMDSLNMQPSVIFFTNLMHISIANRKPDMAVRSFDLMEQYGLVPDQFCANKLMEGLQKTCKNPETVDAIRSRLQSYGVLVGKLQQKRKPENNFKPDHHIDRENRNDSNITPITQQKGEAISFQVNIKPTSDSLPAEISNKLPSDLGKTPLSNSQKDKPRQFGTVIKPNQAHKIGVSKIVKSNLIR